MKKILFLLLLIPYLGFSQDDLLDELDSETEVDKTITAAFKGLKIINFETTKLANKGDLYFIVSHRFGTVKNGIDDFFGFDQAVTQIKFIYGFTKWLNIGAARSSNQQKYGLHAKYRLLHQKEDGSPVAIVGYHLVTANTSYKKDNFPKIKFSDRLTYTSQIIISRKFCEQLSMLVSPTFIHENLATQSIQVENGLPVAFNEDNNQFAVGLGARYKISKRVSINADWGIHLNRNQNSSFRDPISVGVDIETGGHVFQLHFTNAQAMFEEGYIIQGAGNWQKGDFYFGFNLNRVF